MNEKIAGVLMIIGIVIIICSALLCLWLSNEDVYTKLVVTGGILFTIGMTAYLFD